MEAEYDEVRGGHQPLLLAWVLSERCVNLEELNLWHSSEAISQLEPRRSCTTINKDLIFLVHSAHLYLYDQEICEDPLL